MVMLLVLILPIGLVSATSLQNTDKGTPSHFSVKATPSTLWTFNINGTIFASPTAKDLDKNGIDDVVVCTQNGYIYALKGDSGESLWTIHVSGEIYSSPAITDVLGDDTPWIIVGVSYRTGGSLDKSSVLALGGNYTIWWNTSLGGAILSSPSVADIDGNGIKDVLIGSANNTFFAIRGNTGEVMWNYTARIAPYSVPAVGDINNDGKQEVVFIAEDGTLRALRGDDGSLLWD